MGCSASKEDKDLQQEAIPAAAKKATKDAQAAVAEKKVEAVAKQEAAEVEVEEKKDEWKGSPKVLVLYYSMYGHIAKMADSVAEGAQSAGAAVRIMRIPETLPEEVLKKMGAPPKNLSHPEVTPDDIAAADCILIGIPTRFGMAAAQVKALMDRTGKLWMTGGLVGKVGGVFFSTATQGGGQETTAMTFITQFVHHGMLYVPIGYSNPKMFDMTTPHGGSPYGAGCLAGPDGSRAPSELELDIARHQGEFTTKFTARLVGAAA
mmetsp:Transcript_21474/g.40237  ORF Transcript_21474/g.40237 Transcript_21474/m.40237 type:complete len:263 (-) Transcript_21474:446-1234(-)|eukprot:CAMPEP_0170183732 /NCGR_PEP_ID=MMETSP0040_2-20121228/31541_1 /TAXON_ID=641309 /ORGANISM="Lotharella oceanica, Strain CCMP622" /LENGTH=262 /DNA_ID=CAMNT_0010429561 /DNA_START=64 /DNA_END=855 /DNA_ORIENTATION=+